MLVERFCGIHPSNRGPRGIEPAPPEIAPRWTQVCARVVLARLADALPWNARAEGRVEIVIAEHARGWLGPDKWRDCAARVMFVLTEWMPWTPERYERVQATIAEHVAAEGL